jgi:adhesin/invasin
VTATAAGTTSAGDVLGTLDVETEGYTVAVAPATKTLVATGHDTATVVATAESASGKKLSGLAVSFASDDDAQRFSAVSAGASGTYSATLTGSAMPGSATVTPVVTGAGSPTITGTEVSTEAYTVSVAAPTRPMVGTGWDSLTVTARVESTSGKQLTGLDLDFESTDDGQVVGPVTDHGDGTYSATLTGSTALGPATVNAVVSGAGSPAVSAAEVATEGYAVTVLPLPEHLLATGSATRVVVARAQSASGRAVPDLDVTFASTDSGQRFGSVSDRGDGTYSARLTGSTTPGNASISVQVAGAGSPVTVPAVLVSDAYLKPALTAVVSAAAPARNGWYRSPVTVTFTCAGSLPLVAACPEPAVLSADGSGQVVTRSVTDTLGSSASVTSAAVSIDATRPTLKVKVKGAKKGATYAKAPKLSCAATDKLSGVATCTIATKKAKSKRGTLVRWTAVALDKAGNGTSSKGSYTIRKKGARR